MKKNNLLWIAVLLLGACTKKPAEPLLVKWEKKTAAAERSLLRALASGRQNQCMRDAFTVETLKAEVRELERRFTSGRAARGRWRHLDLATLPVPQGNFLKTFGRDLGDLQNPEAIDFSGCADVPCIFNKIYGKGDAVHGYVHYIWYLKFGNYLAADNKVPLQQSLAAGVWAGKSLPLSSYLLDERELYAFWRISHMLKAPHTTLRYLTQIQRVPRGERFEQPENARACGLAYSQGFITLTDECLKFGFNDDLGWIYQAVTHELSHQVDMEEGRGSMTGFRSNRQDYVTLSGLVQTEFVDAAGKPQRGWQPGPDAKVVSDYAKTNPVENFAESVAVYRVEGERAKAGLSGPHYGFVSRSYYQNREFTIPALMASWLQEQNGELSRSILKAVVYCREPSASGRSQYFRRGDFSVNVPANLLACVSERASEISVELRASVSLSEPEGCAILSVEDQRTRWNALVKEHLKAAFEHHLAQIQRDPQYVARIQSYLGDIENRALARTAYVSCYKEANEAGCYDEQLRKQTLERLRELSLPEADMQELARMYFTAHPFDAVRDDTIKLYQTFVQDNLESIRTAARETWGRCESISHNDADRPTGQAFSVSDGYLISSFYNCLNLRIPEAVSETIRNFSVNGGRVEGDKEERLLSIEVQPHFVRIIRELYDAERAKELRAVTQRLQQDQGETRRKLLADLSWVKNVADPRKILLDCKVQGYKLIGMTPLYNLPATVFGEFLEREACQNITAAPEFGAWIDSSQGTLREQVTANLGAKMLERGQALADECLREFPNTNPINRLLYRRSREACFTNRWPAAEARLVSDLSNDPLIRRLNLDRRAIETQLARNRSALQQQILLEKLR
jgi:hypothetical protein